MTEDVQRKCIACYKIQDRNKMIKITRQKSTDNIFINPDSKIFGRSAYLCYNNSCIKETLKKNRLNKALKIQISDELKQQLETFYKEQIMNS